MKKLLLSMATVPLLVGGLSVSASADGINIFSDAKLKGEIRPRFETADVIDNGKDAATSFTARTHLSVSAGLLEVEGLSATVGIQSVNSFGYESYNSTLNGETTYDVIKDPQFAMISEASLNYKTGKTDIHAGRSQLNLDNQRFIGTVGWRQLERSYDTVSVTNTDVKNLKVYIAYLYGMQGVGAAPTKETNSILFNAKYKVMDELTVTAYDYMMGSETDTMGIALTGNIDAGAKLNYRAEYAMQSDPTMEYRVKNIKADATYINLDLGANISGVLAGANYEVLSGTNSADKTAFKPSYGTNHKFNGWADVFYVAASPTSGLKDANLRLGYAAKGFGKVLAVYHSYTAETTTGTNSDDLGSEIDVLYVNKIPGVNGLSGLLKYASFSKGAATNGFAASQSDKQVAWAQLDYKF
ncbi:hypothetical protein GJV85_09485 [Sulfurimonas aquatica]|uniref:Alginate export domain-containing protein n=1 Tax=Sulfurimonas aquatica TaxID=2672570 RepID=A0A975B181_9BACT|nr:hypothetical protein [Sulfurimonas aquatica]QSZ42329.1 hypothetical protein GJV85_09485 [Sulfurimonas aquatica]